MDLISQGAIRVGKILWQPGHGAFAVTVVCKATFELQMGSSPLSATQEPIVEADVYNSAGSSLLVATDLVPFKRRPEVLVVGHAHAPDERPVQSLMTRLVVGEMDKSILVVGDRHMGLNGQLSEPARFTRMPLVWERAAGGPGTENPAGVPAGNALRTKLFSQIAVPNLLPRGTSIQSPGDIIPPIGFGPIAPLWPSRIACLHGHAAGWDPSRWHERPLPPDIDLAYLNAAPADQQRTAPFGEESLYLEGLHPRFPCLATRLAPITPVASVDMGSGPDPLKLRCDTLIIDTDRGLAMLVWRAHIVLEHPERPARVVISAPNAPEKGRASRPPALLEAAHPTTTLVPALLGPSGPALPFEGGAATALPDPANEKVTTAVLGPEWAAFAFDGGAEPTSRPGHAPESARNKTVTAILKPSDSKSPFGGGAAPALPKGHPSEPPNEATVTQPVGALAWLTASQPSTQTSPPGLFPRAAPLPFAQAPQGGEPPRAASHSAGATGLPFGVSTTAVPPSNPAPKFGVPFTPPAFVEPSVKTETAEWQPAPNISPPQISAPNISPPQISAPNISPPPAPPPAPATAPDTSPNASPEPDATEARLRLIQRAIWKGDRPIQQILAEHNLTEVEWRAMKRAFMRKPGA